MENSYHIFFSKIKDSIALNNLEDAVDQLYIFFKEMNHKRGYNEIIIHLSKLNELNRDNRLGVIDRREANKERTKIKYAIIDLIDDFSIQFSSKSYITSNSTSYNENQYNNNYSDQHKSDSLMDNTDNEISQSSRLLRVFLSYSPLNLLTIRKLYRKLNKDWIDLWFDEEKLLPGQNVILEIKTAINLSDVVIICISQECVNKSGSIQKEIRYAMDISYEQPEKSIFIIPLKLNECSVPDRLTNLECVNYYEKDGVNRLIQALKYRAQELGILKNDV